MVIKEIHGDLFAAKDCVFIQCISADLACGAGIAVQFNKHFDIKNRIRKRLCSQPMEYWADGHYGFAILEEPVISLVTKFNYYEKPDAATLRNALEAAARICRERGYQDIAMPRIASGLDRMDWEMQVRPAIEEAFGSMDVHITVYLWP